MKVVVENEALTKRKAREIVADKVAHSISNIPQILEDDYSLDSFSEEDKRTIIEAAESLCIKACKSIGKDYYSY